MCLILVLKPSKGFTLTTLYMMPERYDSMVLWFIMVL